MHHLRMLHWNRKDHPVDIDCSETGDSEMVNYPHLFEPDGQTYMFYQGMEWVNRFRFGC